MPKYTFITTVFVFMVCTVVIASVAYQTHLTQRVERHLALLQKEQTAQVARLRALRAEWAYLNRPQRLRALCAVYCQQLELVSMSYAHFGALDDFATHPTSNETPTSNATHVISALALQ